MNRLPYIAKAIAAGCTAFAGALATALTDQVVTSAEWIGIAGATVIALATTYTVPNRQPAQDGDR